MQRTTFTNRTPLPNTLSEEAVLRILHDHAAMIEQNPLVIHYERISTPDDAPEDERDGAWYELTDRISYLPCGLLQGKLNYRGYLHDTPQGLRTHIYAPLGVHIHDYWTVHRRKIFAGETGPPSVFYLQEEVELICPFITTSFVRRTLSQSHSELVTRLVAAGGGSA